MIREGALRLEGQVVDADDHPVGGRDGRACRRIRRARRRARPMAGLRSTRWSARPYTLVARAPAGGRRAGHREADRQERSGRAPAAAGRKGRRSRSPASDGKPIDGATVELRGDRRAARRRRRPATTTFAPVVPGGYQLAAWADGTARTLQWLQVGAGETAAKLDARRRCAASRAASSTRAGSRRRRRARHVSRRLGLEPAGRRAARRRRRPTRRRVQVRGAAGGLVPVRRPRTPTYARGSSALVTLDGKNEQRGVTITLAAGAVVRGIVVDATKQPVAAARVRIGIASRRGMMFEPPRQAYTDGKGAFEIKGLPRRELAGGRDARDRRVADRRRRHDARRCRRRHARDRRHRHDRRHRRRSAGQPDRRRAGLGGTELPRRSAAPATSRNSGCAAFRRSSPTAPAASR